MVINKKNLGEFITSIHNMESVVEVYYDKKKNIINELKCLNYNRYKVYHYTLNEYSENINKYHLKIPGLL